MTRWAEQDCAFLNKNSRWDDWECRKDGGWFHAIKALCERHRWTQRPRVKKLKILNTFVIKVIIIIPTLSQVSSASKPL